MNKATQINRHNDSGKGKAKAKKNRLLDEERCPSLKVASKALHKLDLAKYFGSSWNTLKRTHP